MIVSSDWLLIGAIYALIGGFAGIMAGILGIGGGVIVVPGLLFVFKFSHIIPQDIAMYVAAGSSLAVMIITSQSSLRTHLKIGEVLWHVFRKLVLGIFIGTICGSILATMVPTSILQIIFALFLMIIGVKMILDLHVTHPQRTPSKWTDAVVSYFIGFQSGLLGVGGGVLVVPYLTYCGIPIRQIAGVANLITLTVALVGTGVFLMSGHQEMAQVSYSTGYIYWPAVLSVAVFSSIFAPLGARLNYIVPVKQLKFCFIVILYATAISLLL